MIPSDETKSGPVTHRFQMGELFVTTTALKILDGAEMSAALARHVSGDWGDVCEEDAEENELSVKEGYRIFSVYHAQGGTKFWIITEADRSVTTILLPSDY